MFSRLQQPLMLVWVSLLCGILLGAGQDSAQAAPFAYITSPSGDSLMLLDAATLRAVPTRALNRPSTAIALNPSATRLYISTPSHTLFVPTFQGLSAATQVLDTTSNTIVGSLPDAAQRLIVTRDRVYALRTTISDISVFDAFSHQPVQSLESPLLAPAHFVLDPAGTTLYVTNTSLQTIALIDARSLQILTTLTVGAAPDVLAVSHDGTRLFVVHRTSNTVSVIDTLEQMVITTIPLPGRGPNSFDTGPAYALAVNQSGTRLYVASVFPSGTVTVIDTATHTVLATIALPGQNRSFPTGIAVTPDDRQVFVVGSDPQVAVIDATTHAIIGTIPDGGSRGISPFFVPSPLPVLALSAGPLDFHDQFVGVASPAQTVVVTNQGQMPLTFTQLAVTGDFAFTTTCEAPLAPGDSCRLNILFRPTATGARQGVLTLTDNADGSPQTIMLSGNGVSPAATLSTTAVEFAPQGLGSVSAAQHVAVTNSGTALLLGEHVAVSGDFFVDATTCLTLIAPGGACFISVRFAPSQRGARTGELTLTDTAADSPRVVQLTGVGTAPVPPEPLGQLPTVRSLTTFALPTPGATPTEIIVGPDGHLWFAETTATQVGQISLSGDIQEFALPPPPQRTLTDSPASLTVGPDGAIWTGSAASIDKVHVSSGRAERITTTLRDALRPMFTSRPMRLITGPDGLLWYADWLNGGVQRLTTTGQLATGFPAGPPFPCPPAPVLGCFLDLSITSNSPAGLATDPDGNVWATVSRTDNIVALHAAGFERVFHIPSAVNRQAANFGIFRTVAAPAGITRGPNDSMWFTMRESNRIGRIDRHTESITEFPLPTPASAPTGIALGADGNLWFTAAATGRLGRLTPTGAVTEFALGAPDSGPTGIALGADGNLWVTLARANAVVRFADPAFVSQVAWTAATYRLPAGAPATTLTLTRAGNIANTATVFYTTRDGTATAEAGQYTPAAGLITFAPGDIAQTVTITRGPQAGGTTRGDFLVTLSSPTGGAVLTEPASVTVVLENDITAEIVEVQESGGGCTLSAPTSRSDLTMLVLWCMALIHVGRRWTCQRHRK